MLGKPLIYRLFPVFFLFLFVQTKGLSQYKGVLKGNPVAFGFGIFNLDYERVLNRKTTLTVSAAYYYVKNYSNIFGAWAQYRYYFTHKKKPVPAGFYVGVDGGIGSSDGDSIGLFGFLLGYQWLMDSGVAIDLGIGPQYPMGGNADGLPIALPIFSIGYYW